MKKFILAAALVAGVFGMFVNEAQARRRVVVVRNNVVIVARPAVVIARPVVVVATPATVIVRGR